MVDTFAIEVKGAKCSYGSLKVLKRLDMNVRQGSIYGLLGSSGCGKTTLLRCILGRLSLSNGNILVFGKAPGSLGHTIPGKDVGYMPQELALFGDFTMMETMYYFGILNKMSRRKIKERAKFLSNLLELPSVSKCIKNLSGGQQRRVSFAVAMIQEPPLLILDEPTVGVDPLLRAKIWKHLLDLVESSQTTIVITTHYIEEARQAHMVGLMRDGRLLAESPPNELIQYHHLSTLEEVFLLLCRQQESRALEGSHVHQLSESIRIGAALEAKDATMEEGKRAVVVNEETPLLAKVKGDGQNDSLFSRCTQGVRDYIPSFSCGPCNPASFLPRPQNIAALFWKNVARISRNPGTLFFQFALPTLQIVLFCLAIGRSLMGVNVSVVMMDEGLPDGNEACNVSNFGQLFVSQLNNQTLSLHYRSNLSEAIDDVKHGRAWAAIFVPENFTVHLVDRVQKMTRLQPVPDYDLVNSSIELYEDVTDLQITYALTNETTTAVEKTLLILMENCNTNMSLYASPLQVHTPPVYGRTDLSYTDYVTPGMIISVTFGIAIGLTALAFVVERKEGLIDRTWVAGVNVTELILSQVITQFFVLLVQIVLLVVVVIYAFKVYNVYTRNILLVGLLAMLQGLTGMTYGLLISSFCSDETSAIQLMAGSFYPILVLSGIIWPLEGMPKVLRYISYFLPTTFAAEAMRSIMERGWGLDEILVWRGFVVSIVWFMLFMLLAILGMKLRK